MKKNKKLNTVMPVLIFLFFISNTNLYTEENPEPLPVLTVLDFDIKNISQAEGELIVKTLASSFVKTGYFAIIDKTQRDAILQEQEFSLSDCTDESCQIEIGKLLAADFIVAGSLGKIEENFIININVIDVETSETVQAVTEKYPSLDNMLNQMDYIALKLSEKEEIKRNEIAKKEKKERNEKLKKALFKEKAFVTGIILDGVGLSGLITSGILTVFSVKTYNDSKELYSIYQTRAESGDYTKEEVDQDYNLYTEKIRNFVTFLTFSAGVGVASLICGGVGIGLTVKGVKASSNQINLSMIPDSTGKMVFQTSICFNF